MVVDTTKLPLAARIQPNAMPAPTPRTRLPPRSAIKTRQAKPTRAAIKNKKPAPKKQPKKKKTIEELDQEMADYFATNDK